MLTEERISEIHDALEEAIAYAENVDKDMLRDEQSALEELLSLRQQNAELIDKCFILIDEKNELIDENAELIEDGERLYEWTDFVVPYHMKMLYNFDRVETLHKALRKRIKK